MQHFIIVTLLGLLLYVGVVPAEANNHPTRPDFQITRSEFDGRNLRVEYINATGVYNRNRYDVAVQWHDANGNPIGTRRWLPIPQVDRGGVSIIKSPSRIELSYRRGKKTYGESLTKYIAARPDAAAILRVTVDDGDRIAEVDEKNNEVRLSFPLPDLVAVGAKFLDEDSATFTYRKDNVAAINDPFRIGFTWIDNVGELLAATRWVNVLEPLLGKEITLNTNRTDASYLNEKKRQANDRLDWYLARRPEKATQLKIMVDDAGTVTEANEDNNTIVLQVPLPKYADLTVQNIEMETEEETVVRALVTNSGEKAAPKSQGRIRIDIGNDGTWDLSSPMITVPALPVGESTSITASFKLDVPEGDYGIEGCVDVKSAIKETDESNNCFEGEITIAPEDESTTADEEEEEGDEDVEEESDEE